ncbi:PROTEIN RETICULATA-RELATED 1 CHLOROPLASTIC-LIKE [Salix viminalis]|uniref:PROTEIN RETICULATA-RELATED 1 CHLOROPLASTIC-LIKE n=1 Tax=Salix viminalis TaxID=40686 RepID=A0A9Q0QDS6_SALVM|nr:PROTEIN RETICULATA-RELATED 1 CHLOROPLASTIC-LIKE [Salix viminalis]
MPHFVLQTAQVPTPTSRAILSLKPTFPIPQLCHLRRRARSNRNLDLKCSSSSSCPMIDGGGDSVAALERCFSAPPAPVVADFGPVMKGKFGSLGAVTLEKSKLDMSQKQSQSTPERTVLNLQKCDGSLRSSMLLPLKFNGRDSV